MKKLRTLLTKKIFLIIKISLLGAIVVACSTETEMSGVETAVKRSVTEVASRPTPTVRTTSPNPNITKQIESGVSEADNTSTPLPAVEPTEAVTPIPIPTLFTSEVALSIEDKTDLLTVGSLLWHPEYISTLKIDIEAGGQPWSPNGSHLVGWSQTVKSLVTLDLETGEERSLGINARSAFWSPDGSQLLYSIDIPANESDSGFNETALYIFNLAAKQERLVAGPFQSSQLVQIIGWAFDSQKIAYIRLSEPPSGDASTSVLEILGLEKGDTTQFSGPITISFLNGAWSPVDNQLLILGSTLGDNLLEGGLIHYSYEVMYLLNLETNKLELLRGPSERSSSFSQYNASPYGYFVSQTPWSDDGQQVIYSDRGLICYMEIQSGGETCLTDLLEMTNEIGAVGSIYPSFSPTGNWIGFILKFEDLFCSPIAVIRFTGDNLRSTDAQANECSLFGPHWSPSK